MSLALIRGDDRILTLTASIDGAPLALEEGDVLRFRVFESDGSVLISKDATLEDQDTESLAISLALTAADTEGIDIEADTTLRWEAEIVFADGRVLTPFYNRTLVIKPDRITPDMRGESV